MSRQKKISGLKNKTSDIITEEKENKTLRKSE
jgi:hypothetical protein